MNDWKLLAQVTRAIKQPPDPSSLCLIRIELQAGVWFQSSRSKADQMPELRSLFLNIKDKTNPGLRNKIVLGSLRYEEVVVMTKEVSRCSAESHVLKYGQSPAYHYSLPAVRLFLSFPSVAHPDLATLVALRWWCLLPCSSQQEMASASVKAMNQKIAKDNLFKAKAVGETQVQISAFAASAIGLTSRPRPPSSSAQSAVNASAASTRCRQEAQTSP